MRFIPQEWTRGVNRSSSPTSALAVVFLLALFLGPPVAVAQAIEPLTLRVGDSEGAPGEIVGVVLRTYAARPVGQGQVCLRRRPPSALAAAASPFSEMLGWQVFSVGADARAKGELDRVGVVLGFRSPTDGINASDGPLAVVYLRLRADLSAGQTLDLELDPVASNLFSGGLPIALDLRPGRVKIVAPGSAVPISAEVEANPPGVGGTRIGLELPRVLSLSTGRLVVVLDPAFIDEPLEIVADPRAGIANWQVVRGAKGTLVLSFTSPDASLGMVPGPLVTIFFPTTEPTTGVAPATFVPAASALFDALGNRLPL